MNLEKIAFGLFTLIIFVGFVIFAMEVLHKEPQYNDYFQQHPILPSEITDQPECEQYGGKWVTAADYDKNQRFPPPRPAIVEKGDPRDGSEVIPPQEWCDLDFYANEQWNAARETHDRYAAIILGVVSVGSLLLFATKRLPAPMGAGIGFGGIILAFYSLSRYWEHLDDIWRVLVLGVLLVITIIIGFIKYGSEANPK